MGKPNSRLTAYFSDGNVRHFDRCPCCEAELVEHFAALREFEAIAAADPARVYYSANQDYLRWLEQQPPVVVPEEVP